MAYSNSSIKTYEQCPYKYKLTRIEIRSAQDALYHLAKRGVANDNRFILTGLELKALNLGMEIHDAQLDACTIQMLEQAIDIVAADIKNRKARPITEIEHGNNRHPQTA